MEEYCLGEAHSSSWVHSDVPALNFHPSSAGQGPPDSPPLRETYQNSKNYSCIKYLLQSRSES